MEQDTSRVISVCVQTRHFNVSQQLKPISVQTNQCTDQSVYRPISVQTNQCTDQLNIMHKQIRNSEHYEGISG